MNDAEKMDELLAQKLQNLDTGFEERKWEQAQKLIEAYEAKEKRRRFFYIYLGIAGLMLSLGFAIWALSGSGKHGLSVGPTTHSESVTPLVSSSDSVSKASVIHAPASKSMNAESPSANSIRSASDSVSSPSGPAESVSAEIAHKKLPVYSGAKMTASVGSTHAQSADFSKTKKVATPEATESGSTKRIAIAGLTFPLKQDSILTLNPLKPDSPEVSSITDSIAGPVLAEVNESGGPGWNLYLGGGINYLLGSSLQPAGGLFLTRAFSHRWEFGTGLQYTAIHGSSKNLQTLSTDTFSFGIKSTQTQITAEKLHYLVIPLFARFKAFGQIHILFGANASYLITSTDRITTTQTAYNTVLSNNSRKDHGYIQGYQLYDAGLLGGMEWDFWKRFSSGIYFNYGLLNLTKASYFGNVPAFRNNSIEFLIRYQLIKH
ncbi:MAG: porin family protein [Bacteroidia bacterium]